MQRRSRRGAGAAERAARTSRRTGRAVAGRPSRDRIGRDARGGAGARDPGDAIGGGPRRPTRRRRGPPGPDVSRLAPRLAPTAAAYRNRARRVTRRLQSRPRRRIVRARRPRRTRARSGTLAGMRADYEYRGLMAAAWDLLRGDTSGWQDRPFYRDLIERSGQPALDVGCGTGRLRARLPALGHRHRRRGQLAGDAGDLPREGGQRRASRPALYLQEMQALDLPRRYRTIIVPSSSFQLVLDPTDAAAAMARFAAHLEPGGLLVMPFIALGRPGAPLEETWVARGDPPGGWRHDPADGLGALRPDDPAGGDARPLRGDRRRARRALRDPRAEPGDPWLHRRAGDGAVRGGRASTWTRSCPASRSSRTTRRGPTRTTQDAGAVFTVIGRRR